MARTNLAASAAAFPLLHDTSLPLVFAVCGGCVGALLVVLCGQTRRSLRFLLSVAGGLVVVVAMWALEATPMWPAYPVGSLWRVAPPALGGLVAALSLTTKENSVANRKFAGNHSY